MLVPVLQGVAVLAHVVTPDLQLVGNCTGSPDEIAKAIRGLVSHRHSEFTRINRIANPSPPFRFRVVLDGGEGLRDAGEKLSCRGISEAPACLAAFAAMEGTGLTLVASSKGPVGPNTPFTFEVPTAAGATGRMALRVFATTKPLDVEAIAKAPADGRADVLLGELRKACPSSAGDEFLGTDGWAAESIWVEFR